MIGSLLDRFHEPIVRLKRIDADLACGSAVWPQGRRSGAVWLHAYDRGEQPRSPHESGADAPDPVRRQFAPSMRS